MLNLTNPETIKEILGKYDISPNKILGQNFLIDRKVLDKIIEAADLKPADNVLEIGPGMGTLTDALCSKGANILAIETDPDLIVVLEDLLKDCQSVKIMAEDFLDINFKEIEPIFHGGPYKIVSNIPYYITSPVIRKIFSFPVKPVEVVLLVQREVAERIAAEPGDMSLISLYVQFHGTPELRGVVKPSSFYPAPKVESAILKITVDKNIDLPEEKEKLLWRLAKMGFSARRKTLANNLMAGLHVEKDKIEKIIEPLGFGGKVRAQELSVGDWLRLMVALDKAGMLG